MSTLLIGLICLATAGEIAEPIDSAPTAEGLPTSDHVRFAIEVRRFSFEKPDDIDFDGQPDDWSRRRGPDFPHYIKAVIDRRHAVHGQQSLRFDVNGGHAAYYSDPTQVHIGAEHAYVLQGWVRTEELDQDAAFISLSVLDAQRQRLRRYLGRPISGTHQGWVRVEVGPIAPDPRARYLVVGCHLVHGERRDIRGRVWFDDLWIGSLPRMLLTMDSPSFFYKPGAPIRVTADIQGLDALRPYRLVLRLQQRERELATQVFPLEPVPADPATGITHREPIVWELPPQAYGSYCATAILERDDKYFIEMHAPFVVMDSDESPALGEFGWSLPHGTGTMPRDAFPETAAQGGVRWIKYPLWKLSDPQHEAEATEVTRLLERLDRRGIGVVGLLNDPPDQLARKFAYNWVGVSKIFTLAPEVWYPALEPVLARYAFHVQHWQLGDDSDRSFVGLTTLPQSLQGIKQEFDRIGRNIHLGLHWDWEHPLPTSQQTPGTFYSIGGQEELSEAKLAEALATSAAAGVPRWVLLRPPPESSGTTEQRSAQLVRQMITAKIGGAEGIFLNDPFHEDYGLLHANGAPTELFLPWRTAALTLRGTQYLGSLTLEHDSQNAVFARPGVCTMILWRDEPVQETLALGGNVRAFDLWGRPLPVNLDAHSGRCNVEVGPIPIVVTNCSEPLIRWQLNIKFEAGRVSSEYGGHADALLGRNSYTQGISGTAVLKLPKDWIVEPPEWTIQAGVGESFRLPLRLTFPTDSSLGMVKAAILFDIVADRPYRFTVFREYQLGLGDVLLSATSKLQPDGRLEISQEITNSTQPLEMLDFNCSLFIPAARRQRQTVIKLGSGVDHKLYYVENGRDLIGKEVWLRAEQVNGNRVLNYKWIVTDE